MNLSLNSCISLFNIKYNKEEKKPYNTFKIYDYICVIIKPLNLQY